MAAHSGTFSRATSRVLRVTALAWSLAWLATLVLLVATDPAIVTEPTLVGASLAMAGGSWVVLAFAPRAPLAQFVIVVGSVALVIAATVQVIDLSAHVLFLTTGLNLAAIVIALLLPARLSLPAVSALVVTSLAILIGRLWGVADAGLAWRSVLMAAAYCLAVGLAVRVCSTVMRTSAAEVDDEANRADAMASRRAEQDAHRDESERVGRLLHDTCINTLGAIRDGAGLRSPSAVRERCARDLERLDADAPPPSTVKELLLENHESARLLGIPLDARILSDDETPDSQGPARPSSDPAILKAARGAVREALLNVAKHLPEPKASLEVIDTGDSLTVAIRDDGPGWSGAIPKGGGIDRSIRRRVTSTGGRLDMSTSPRSGTTVTMTWNSVTASGPHPGSVDRDVGITEGEPRNVARGGLRTVVLGSGAWLLAYGIAATAIFLGEAPLLGSLVALAIVGVSLALVARSARTRLPRWLDVVLGVGIALVVILPGNDGSCLTTNPAAWGPDGAAVLALIACMLGASAWSAVAALGGFAAGLLLPLALLGNAAIVCAETSTTVLLIEFGVVAVLFAFRRLLLRTWATAEGYRERIRADETTLAISTARDRARAARLSWTVGSAGELLRGIALGSRNPGDPDVMAAAGRMEKTLRSLIVLDPRLGPLGDALAEEITVALDGGRVAEVRTSIAVPEPSAGQLSEIRRIFRDIITSAPSSTSLSLALFANGDGGMITIVTPPNLSPTGVFRSDLEVSVQELDDEALVTMSWKAEAT